MVLGLAVLFGTMLAVCEKGGIARHIIQSECKVIEQHFCRIENKSRIKFGVSNVVALFDWKYSGGKQPWFRPSHRTQHEERTPNDSILYAVNVKFAINIISPAFAQLRVFCLPLMPIHRAVDFNPPPQVLFNVCGWLVGGLAGVVSLFGWHHRLQGVPIFVRVYYAKFFEHIVDWKPKKSVLEPKDLLTLATLSVSLIHFVGQSLSLNKIYAHTAYVGNLI